MLFKKLDVGTLTIDLAFDSLNASVKASLFQEDNIDMRHSSALLVLCKAQVSEIGNCGNTQEREETFPQISNRCTDCLYSEEKLGI